MFPVEIWLKIRPTFGQKDTGCPKKLTFENHAINLPRKLQKTIIMFSYWAALIDIPG